jgi:hypothetical protein
LLPRGGVDLVHGVAFSPEKAGASSAAAEDGSVRTFGCRLCSRLSGLIALGRERPEDLKPRR